MSNLILKQYFKDYLSLYPSFASFLGDRRKDSQFENTLDKSHNIRYGKMMKKYEKIVDDYKGVKDMDFKIMKWILKDNRESMSYPLNLTPLNSFENWVIDFAFINKSLYPLQTEYDIENLTLRHASFREYIELSINKMKVGINQKQVLPKMICEQVISSLEAFIKSEKYIVDVPKHLRNSAAYKEYVQYMKGSYISTVLKLLHFLKKKYIRSCRNTIGLCAVPRGKNMYKYLVRSMTTLNITPEYVHRLGFSEVKRIIDELNTVKILLGYPSTMTLQEFNNAMVGNSKSYFKNESHLMKGYKEIQKEIDENIIPKNFHTNVDSYVIKRVPHSMEGTSAGAFYYPGSSFNNSRKGTFFVNMRDMKENAKFNMLALTLHEGKPGHHYQFQYMIESKVPIHRQYSVNGTAFVEGWALYAESLGDYKNNPYEYFGKLTYEMFRAVRLVVDSGIHYYNWTYKEAVDYMVKHVALSKSEIETEVQRYICIPAQALCYKVGERRITAMKQKYVAVFGSDTNSIKNFHKLFLEEGVIPLSLLEKKITNIIEKKKSILTN